MNFASKVYEKENSFVEIRERTPDRETLYGRIRKIQKELNNYGFADYQCQILNEACDHLFVEPSLSPKPRFNLQDHVLQEVARLRDQDLPRYLFYRYRYEMFPKLKIFDDFPPCLQIEPTSICNYRCVFCYQTDSHLTDPKNGHMGSMSLELFKKIVDQANGKCEAVTLASRGEPLMNRHIKEMLAYASRKFLALKVNTNAWFLDERKSHAILQAGVNTLVFSADAASEPLYSQLRIRGKLDRVLANVRRFQEIRFRHYPHSKIITRVSGVQFSDSQNLDEMEGVWGELVDQVAFVKYNPWENTYQRPVNDIAKPCSDLWRRTFVWFDGTVNPCDVDYRSSLAVGDANREPLSQVWTGVKYSRLREAHLASQRSAVSPCNRCTVI